MSLFKVSHPADHVGFWATTFGKWLYKFWLISNLELALHYEFYLWTNKPARDKPFKKFWRRTRFVYYAGLGAINSYIFSQGTRLDNKLYHMGYRKNPCHFVIWRCYRDAEVFANKKSLLTESYWGLPHY